MEIISVDLPQEEAFQKILDYLRGGKYFWVYGKRGHDIRNLVPPSRMEVRLGASRTVTGKMDIEVVPNNGKSLVKIDFKWLDGRVKLLGLAALPPIAGLLNLYFMGITATLTSPFFLGWLDVGWAKARLITELRHHLLSKT